MQMRLVAEQSRERIANLSELTASKACDELGMAEQFLDASPFLAYRGVHGMLKRHGALLAQPIFGKNFKNTVAEMQALAQRFPQEAAAHATRFPKEAMMLAAAFPELALDGAKQAANIIHDAGHLAGDGVQAAANIMQDVGHLAGDGVQAAANVAVAGAKAVQDLTTRLSHQAQGNGSARETDLEAMQNKV